MYKIYAVCTLLLVIAIADLPSGFYTFLRIAITFGGVLAVFNEYDENINFWVIIFGLIAILYNPIFPIYFYDKSIWMILNIVTASIFGFKAYKNSQLKK